MTTPDTPAKKVVDVEILHLDETGYGYEGKHTRREWRAECLEHFEKGAKAFLAWQESWQQLAEQNTLKANFDVQGIFGYANKLWMPKNIMRSHCLDFAGHFFNADFYCHIYTFLNDVSFRAATFKGEAYFGDTTFTSDAYFGAITVKGFAYFSMTSFTGIAEFDEATFSGSVEFNRATFTGCANFRAVNFEESTSFYKAKFHDRIDYRLSNFKGEVDFENSEFANIGHFEGVTFNAATSKIPSFRGVDMGSTRLDFALDLQNDSTFTINYFSEYEIRETIINIEHLI